MQTMQSHAGSHHNVFISYSCVLTACVAGVPVSMC